ncbi:MAG: GNAT family N-acetyltransferase [Cyclobacteriaceae bacterium]
MNLTKPFLETERLWLREFTHDDFDLVYNLSQEPAVMRYIGPVKNKEEALKDLNRYIAYYVQHPGYGYWAAFENQTDQFVGWFLLKILEETGENEIGYRLRKEFWGRGIATEGGQGLIDYGQKKLGISRFVAVADPKNKASRRVLEKLGLIHERDGRFYNFDCVYYAREM